MYNKLVTVCIIQFDLHTKYSTINYNKFLISLKKGLLKILKDWFGKELSKIQYNL